MNQYKTIINNILNIKEDETPKDYWTQQMTIPLLTRRRWHEYDKIDYNIPENEIYGISMSPKTNFQMLICGKTGRQKTRMVKNIVRGFYKAGWKILIFEPKSMEFIEGINAGKGVRIAPHDYNEEDGLPFKSFTPTAFYDWCKQFPDVAKKTNFFSLNILELNYKEIWQSFGCPMKGAEIIVNCVNEGITNIDLIKRKIMASTLTAQTKNPSMQVLDTLEASGVFNKKYPILDLDKEWKDKQIVTINMHLRQGAMMNTYIGLITTQARIIGQKEGNNVTKKLIIFDDSFLYAGAMAYNFARAEINYAQNEMAQCQYNYRRFGIDSIVIIQNLDPASISPTLVEGRDEFLITRTGSSEQLRQMIPYDAYNLVVNQNPMKGGVLVSDKANYYFEWVYVKDDKWCSGFPLDCTVGHP